MKHYAFIAVLFIAACLIAVPASAGAVNTNTSLQTPSSTAEIRYHNMTVLTPTAICAVYGKAPKALSGYDYNAVWVYYSPSPYTNKANVQAGYQETLGDLGYLPAEVNLTYNAPVTDISVGQIATCDDNLGYVSTMHQYYNSTANAPAPVVNFTCAPVDGGAPLTTACVDNSTGYITKWGWEVSPTGTAAWALPNASASTLYLPQNGNYTITHMAGNTNASSSLTKSNYIYVHNSTEMVTTGFRAKDGTTGNIIIDAAISMQDIENNSWKNGTAVRGTASISVLTGHHINAYATATGYGDADTLALLATPYTYDITMLPTGFANVSAGNVTAYITVKDYDTLQTMNGVQVTAGYANNLGDAIYLDAVTNGAGVAAFVLPNKTNVHFAAQKAGYGGASIVLNTGTASGGDAKVVGEIKLSKNWVTPTITGTLLPDGSTPTATQTILPGCEDPNSVTCRNAHSNQGLNYLGDNMMMLIELCVLVTICYLLGVKL